MQDSSKVFMVILKSFYRLTWLYLLNLMNNYSNYAYNLDSDQSTDNEGRPKSL